MEYSEAPETRDDRARLLGKVGAVGDVILEVLELTGSPGVTQELAKLLGGSNA